MAEEQESTGTSLKNILIGLVSTVTLGVGGFITNKLTGGEEEGAKTEVAAPVINITNTNQQSQQAAAGGKTVIIKEKSVPAPAQAQPAPVKPKKTETEKRQEEGLDW